MPKPKKNKNDSLEELLLSIKLCCDRAKAHMKVREYEKALQGYNQALDLNPNDINALVARSKCFLLLGEPNNALQDAEAALALDKNNIRATYQKAESLYFLGQFEQSLMFFHRGYRARPELSAFRLGVQKTQEAIENTIGAKPKTSIAKPKKPEEVISKQTLSSKPPPRPKTSKISNEKRNARKLLGDLCVDKEYLENLLNHPDLKKADTNTENISVHAKDAVDFLNKRQEFWRQQRPCTALPNQKNIDSNDLPAWF